MSIETTSDVQVAGIPSDILADGEEAIAAALAGKKLAPEIASRIHERAAKITEEILRDHGLLDIAVPAIRELRDV